MLSPQAKKKHISTDMISAPLEAKLPTLHNDGLTATERLTKDLAHQISLVDSYRNGVDITQIQKLLPRKLTPEEQETMIDAGGWERFTAAQTRFECKIENNKTIVYLDEEFDHKYRNETKETLAQEGAGASADGNRSRKPSRRTLESIADISLQPESGEIDAPLSVSLTKKTKLVVESLLEIHNVMGSVPSRSQIHKDALYFLRSITLLLRFRRAFPGRTHEQIVQRLLDEGELRDIADINMMYAMAVEAGLMRERKEGFVATAAGLKIIKFGQREPVKELNMRLIDSQVRENFVNLKPTSKSDLIRARVVAEIQRHLDNQIRGVGFTLELFGSSNNTLYTPGSDVDICAYYNVSPAPKQLNIRQLGSILRKARFADQLYCVSGAKIPVCKFIHKDYDLPVDISIENTIALENTNMIRIYMELDERAQELAFALKSWSKRRCIAHPEEGTLSSYSWVLMLIHYLQRTSPPVLPFLQEDRDGEFKPFVHSYGGEIIECAYDENPGFKSSNQSSTGDLLVGFFKYYTTFDWSDQIVNIRGEFGYRKKDQEPNFKNKPMAIEDPFIRDRNTAVACTPKLAEWIWYEIERAHNILMSGGSYAEILEFALS